MGLYLLLSTDWDLLGGTSVKHVLTVAEAAARGLGFISEVLETEKTCDYPQSKLSDTSEAPLGVREQNESQKHQLSEYLS